MINLKFDFGPIKKNNRIRSEYFHLNFNFEATQDKKVNQQFLPTVFEIFLSIFTF